MELHREGSAPAACAAGFFSANHQLMNQLMSDEVVYRTASATPGLLKILAKENFRKIFPKCCSYRYSCNEPPLLQPLGNKGNELTCPWSAEPLCSQPLIPDVGSCVTDLLPPSNPSYEELCNALNHDRHGPQKLSPITSDANPNIIFVYIFFDRPGVAGAVLQTAS